jgi:hypothetical protein
LGSDHHRAAGELAVVKVRNRQLRSSKPRPVDSDREGPRLETSERQKNRRLVADFSPSAAARAAWRNPDAEIHAQQVDEMMTPVR